MYRDGNVVAYGRVICWFWLRDKAIQPCLQFKPPGELYKTLIPSPTHKGLAVTAWDTGQMSLLCGWRQESFLFPSPPPALMKALLFSLRTTGISNNWEHGRNADRPSGPTPDLLNQNLRYKITGCVICTLDFKSHWLRPQNLFLECIAVSEGVF